EFTPSSQAISLDEGGAGSFAVRLTTQPDEAVLVTPAQTGTENPDVTFTTGAMGFTRSNWNVFQTVAVSAAEDDDAVTDSAAIGLSAAGADYDSITGSVSVSVIDNDRTGLSLSKSSLEVDEGGGGGFTVALTTRPSETVTVSLGQSGAVNPDVTLSVSTLSFTGDDWNTAQSVTLSAAEDQDAETDTATIRLTASGGDYGDVTGSVSVAVLDNDIPALIISADSLALSEGGSQTFTVALGTRPSFEVTVDLSRSGSSGVSFSPTSLNFTSANWSTPQTVTVNTAQDADALSEAAMISLTASGGGVGGAGGAGGIDSGGGYGGVTGSVSVSVTDSNMIGLVLSQSDLAFDEGSGGTFTVRLKTAPSAGVTLTLVQSGTANSDLNLSPRTMSFTASSWNAAQTVMLSAVRDDDAVDDSATIGLSAAGGDYDGVSGSLSVTVGDLDEIALALSTERLTLGEGASATFTVALDSQPGDDVTVDLSLSGSGDVRVSPASLIFTASDWSRVQTVTVSAAGDEDALGESAVIGLAASGGGYDSAAGSVSVSVTDDEATALVLSEASPRLDEGGSARITVHLSSQPSGAVTVTLGQPSNTDVTLDTDSDTPGMQDSLSFTASDWSAPKHVLLLAAEDSDALDETAEVALRAAGGDYAGITAQLQVRIVDDDSVGIRALPNPVAVMEGGSAAMQVALQTRPSGAVTLTLGQIGTISGDIGLDADPHRSGSQATLSFTESNWSEPQTVQISAGEDSDTLDDAAVIALSAAGGGYTGVIQTVEISVTDDDEPSLVLSSTELTVAEGDAIGFAVVLSSRPSGGVSVELIQPSGAEASLDGSGILGGVQSALSFTDQNWNQPQVVTVSARHDPDAIDEVISLQLRVAGGAAEYAGAGASVLLTVRDDETAGLSVAPGDLEIAEGATSGFGVALMSQPSSDVQVSIAHAVNTDIRLDTDPGTAGNQNLLRFTPQNWSAAQSVSVAALHDVDSLDYSEVLTMTASGADYAGLQALIEVHVRDDDQQGILISVEEINGAMSVDEGAGVSVGVRLASRPTGAVRIAAVSSDAQALTVSPVQLDFTRDNWALAQTLTVTGVDDADSVSERVRLALHASGADYADLSRILAVRVADDETAGLNLSASLLKVEEGGSASFTVALDNPPIGQVTLELAVSDEAASSVSPTRLTFAPGSWSEPREVSVSGLQDNDWQNDEDVVLLSAAGGGYDAVVGRVAVVVEDDDQAALVLSVESLEVTEGGASSFAVRLSTPPQDAVRVTLADDSGALLLIPGRLDFTRDNWAKPQVVTVVGMDDADGQDDASVLRLLGGGADYEGVSVQLAVTVLDDERYDTTPEEIETARGVLEEVGRAVLSNSLDVIVQRFDAPAGARAVADVGGAEFEIGAEGALDRMLLGAVRHFGASSAPVQPGAPGRGASDRLARLGSIALRDGRPLRAEQDAPQQVEPLLRDFTYPLGGGGGETTVWARFSRAEFSGRFRGLEQYYEGSQGGVSAGVDQRFGNGVLFGAAVSQSAGDARYAIESDGDRVSMDTKLLLVMPYLEVPVRGGVLSLILGSGGGEIESLERNGDPSKAHLSVQMFSLGTKWPLARLGQGERIALSLTAHLGTSRVGSSCSTGGLLCGLSTSSGRLNAGVELTHGEMGGAWRMTPRYELSLRQDSGGQSKGVGMEFSGAIRMVSPKSRFTVDAGLRWLGMHATGEYEEWSGSVELQLKSRDDAGRGLTLGLGPQWGAPQSGALQADGIFGSDRRDLERLRSEAGRTALQARAGYGLDLRDGLLTPFAEYSVSGGDDASGRLLGGLRYQGGETLEARLFGEWQSHRDTQPRTRIGLELSRRF
ncbi:MAG: autotransporter domain-containing protein, partial [Gammaproteobacteria bacterium AqS3]|nr:autotransporter domain-containing protein [Gammaproteobacteria bacterium AqS3]